ncbi:MAG: LamG domain-containing protein [Rhodoferax sp.]|nr:LamG domain-containing protein [Rhodoferax sp.]
MARYWRLVGLSTLGGVALELSSARLSDGTAYSAAVLSCTLPPQTGTLSNLTDGNLTTVVSWSNYAQPGFALVWDCDASPITDALVELGSGAVQANFPLTGRLEHSDDGKFWTVYFEAKSVKWPGANALTAEYSIVDADPSFDSVTLLLHGEGATIVDSSTTPKTLTVVGAAATSTAQHKFGDSSIYFDGAGSRIQTPITSELVPSGIEDFTIEGFLFQTAATDATYRCIFGAYIPLQLYSKSGTLEFYASTSGVAANYLLNPLLGPSNLIVQNQWVHFAVVRFGNQFRVYLGGIGGTISTTSSGIGLSTNQMTLGSYDTGVYPFSGYIDEFRITKGLARYTGDFMPPFKQFPNNLGPAGTLPIDSNLVAQIYALTNPTAPHNLPGSEPQPFGQYLIPECKFAFDAQDGGTGKVSGTVKETGAPDDVPVHRKVRLLEEVSGRAIRETWSDAVTGYYEFKDLSMNQKYTVISYDYHRNYRAVIADNQSALP